MDVKTAFLNSLLEEEIFVEQPINICDGDRRDKVLKLKRALYGLVEAPMLWYKTLKGQMLKMQFDTLKGDPCLFVKTIKRRTQFHMMIIGVFVDDLLMLSTCNDLLQQVKESLNRSFDMKDLGPAQWVLGMRVNQGIDMISIDQDQYLKNLISRFRDEMSECNVYRKRPTTPLPSHVDLRRAFPNEEIVNKPFREVVGSLAYLMTGSRPDIAYAVSWLSRHLSHSTRRHLLAAMHTLLYLDNVDVMSLTYKKHTKKPRFDSEVRLHGAVDSDFGNDVEESKSVSGILVFMNGLISWRSKRQSIVATSTCYAEYVAACEIAREVLWIRNILIGIGLQVTEPAIILEDNVATELLVRNEGITDRSKHIRVKFHHVRECVRDGVMKFVRVSSKENPADALTKPPTKHMLKCLFEAAYMARTNDRKAKSGG